MKTGTFSKALFFVLVLFTLQGCSSYMHGYTQQSAMNRYLLVDQSTENFGYKRMKYNLGYNSNLKGFTTKNGLPNFIYEYENKNGREGIKMYYVKKDIVYIYESQSWTANSLYLKEHRPLNDYEKQTYKQLLISRNQ